MMGVIIIGMLLSSLLSSGERGEQKRGTPWIAGKSTDAPLLDSQGSRDIGEKSAQLRIRCGDIWFINSPVLCSTMVVQAWKPFDEMVITWNNAPFPAGAVLTEYNTQCVYPGWYTWSSTAMENYIDSIIVNHPGEDTIPFFVQIKNRNGGVCDLVWYLQSKESGYSPELIYNSTTYYSIGDSWIADGPPYGPNDNLGGDPDMLVCSCTLTSNSCTQLAMVEFYIAQTGIEEGTKKGEFILRNNPNPFSSFSYISYAVPEKGEVVLRVYDVTGKLVKTLVEEVSAPGRYEVAWNGRNDRGEKLSNGYYFYKLTVRDRTLTTKSLLFRL